MASCYGLHADVFPSHAISVLDTVTRLVYGSEEEEGDGRSLARRITDHYGGKVGGF